MKKYFLCFIILFLAQMTLAQITEREETRQSLEDQNVPVPVMENYDERTVYSQMDVEEKADFPGGMENFYKFVAKTFSSPDEPNLDGKVFLSFTIEKDGSLTDIKAIRDFGYGTGNEAIKMMRKSPKWIPAKRNGKMVRSSFTLPVIIRSNDKN